MSSSWQTIAALLIVVLAAAWLVRRGLVKRNQPGCGSEGCGAVSSDAKALRKRLHKD